MKHILCRYALMSALALTNSCFALVELSTPAAFDTAINTHELVIIDFYMPLCGPCKLIAPLLEELSKQFTNVHFFKVDVTKQELGSLALKYNIRSVPCLVFLKNGVEIGRHKGGSITKNELSEKITSIFSLEI